ncbi:hypothetical protein EVAR_4846_1 [Eumeta japonica]|uniref:Uncharacterized protein n=1 Tax=Eumeta variegata TaxID=151549 RepID=A0A4C1T1T1_EUMVA|nr:hypothetical protein EVAR_4846_1 [Eumeta japonica]
MTKIFHLKHLRQLGWSGGGSCSGGQAALQRACSVPARSPPGPLLGAPGGARPAAPHSEAPRPLSVESHSSRESGDVESAMPAGVSPSSTADSLRGGCGEGRGAAGSREPLLASLDDDPHKTGGGGRNATVSNAAGEGGARLSRLAGVTPLHGHAPHHSVGWL